MLSSSIENLISCVRIIYITLSYRDSNASLISVPIPLLFPWDNLPFHGVLSGSALNGFMPSHLTINSVYILPLIVIPDCDIRLSKGGMPCIIPPMYSSRRRSYKLRSPMPLNLIGSLIRSLVIAVRVDDVS